MSAADKSHARLAALDVRGFPFGGLDTRARSTPTKTSERVARGILEYAEEQGLEPGDPLPTEVVMAESYGVGRISIREALRILEVHGVVEIRMGRGKGPTLERLKARSVAATLRLYFQIRQMTYAEVLDARIGLDPIIAIRAAKRGTAKERASLAEAAKSIDKLDSTQFIELGSSLLRLFIGIGEMAHNQPLALFSHALRDIQTARTSEWYDDARYYRSECRMILDLADAISRGAGDEAVRISEERGRHELRFARRRYPAVLDEVVRW